VVKPKGYTLIELIIYIGMGALLLALVAAFFKISRRQYESASSSYLIGQESSTAIQWVKRDLQETALSTIRITREGSSNPGMPAMSLIAAGENDDHRKFAVSRYGTPAWNRYVFYNLTTDGELYTWTRPLSNLDSPTRFLPVPSTADPTDRNGVENQKVLLREVMQPNQKIQMDGNDLPFPRMTEWGGFKAGFVVYDGEGAEHLVAENPAELSEDLVSDPGSTVTSLDGESLPIQDITTTRLVEVQLAIKLKGFRDNAPSAIMIPLRVSPLH
jgi:type II secretory pathway pseudopilin PulG